MSIVSMTGYGSSQVQLDSCSLHVELKSLNHRFKEVSVKIPRQYFPLENQIILEIKKNILRGKVDVFIRKESLSSNSKFSVSSAGFCDLVSGAKSLASSAGLQVGDDLLFSEALKRIESLDKATPALVSPNEKEALFSCLSEALEALVKMRKLEGETTGQDLLKLLSGLEEIKEKVADFSKKEPARIQNKITERLAKFEEVSEVISKDRIAQEVVILVDKADINEELERLEGHFSQIRECLKKGSAQESSDKKQAKNQGVGRKLDFLSQELLREFNTISSKSVASDIIALVIEAKSLIEKIKEQSANIE